MALSSIFFLFGILPIFLIIYYLSKPGARIYELLIISIWFYYVNDPSRLKWMIAIIVLNYFLSIAIAYFTGWKKKLVLILGILGDTGILFVYKYLGFSAIVINQLLGFNLQVSECEMMAGLSFFTFTLIAYLADVYKCQITVPKNPVKFADYILMFPKIIMGPIVRYSDIEETLNNTEIKVDDIGSGARRFMSGFFKKVIIADNLALLVSEVNELVDVKGATVAALWIGAIAFSLQLFFDFSGYSDMAIGLARMLGFKFRENFNYPYCCSSFTDFWRRWHISLSEWFRDYIYIPLGGSRGTFISNIFNLFVVWLLTGIWHGAGYAFIAWGLIYFIMLLVERYIIKPKRLNKVCGILWRIFTLIVVNFNWVLFSHGDLGEGINYCLGMVGIHTGNRLFSVADVRLLREYGLYLILGFVFSMPIEKIIVDKTDSNKKASDTVAIILPVIYVLLFLWALSFSMLGFHNPFMYQQF